MEVSEEMIINLSSGLTRMEGSQREFTREVLRRLDVLEEEVRSAPQARRASAAAAVSIAAGVLSCMSRLMPWHK
jgi:hypothetical protein